MFISDQTWLPHLLRFLLHHLHSGNAVHHSRIGFDDVLAPEVTCDGAQDSLRASWSIPSEIWGRKLRRHLSTVVDPRVGNPIAVYRWDPRGNVWLLTSPLEGS